MTQNSVNDHIETNIPSVRQAYQNAVDYAARTDSNVYVHMSNRGIGIYVTKTRYDHNPEIFHGPPPEMNTVHLEEVLFREAQLGEDHLLPLLNAIIKTLGHYVIIEDTMGDALQNIINVSKQYKLPVSFVVNGQLLNMGDEWTTEQSQSNSLSI